MNSSHSWQPERSTRVGPRRAAMELYLCRSPSIVQGSDRPEGLLPMDHSVARENIKYFSSRLKSELHPNVRSQVQRLLVKEEDKLGADLEFLAEVERTIISFRALIDTQRRLVATLEHNGGEAERERATLNGLRHTHVLCQMYRQKILVASGKTVLSTLLGDTP